MTTRRRRQHEALLCDDISPPKEDGCLQYCCWSWQSVFEMWFRSV